MEKAGEGMGTDKKEGGKDRKAERMGAKVKEREWEGICLVLNLTLATGLSTRIASSDLYILYRSILYRSIYI